jgi:dihydrolipoamide dehydrogenase
MSTPDYDLLVIGGGPGGYTAAINGAQNGLKTALVEAGDLGGTCLNRGCIPTKTLLHDTGLLPRLRNSHFLTGTMQVDTTRIEARKNLTAEGSRAWLVNLLAGNKVTVIRGLGSFQDHRTLLVQAPDGSANQITARNIIISTGAVVDYPPGLIPDQAAVWSTDDAIRIHDIPKTLAVVGGGARGVELAQIYHNLGTRTVILEAERRLLPKFDRNISGRFRKSLLEQGLKIMTKTMAVSAATGDDGRAVLQYRAKDELKTDRADRVLLCLPRRPNLDQLNLSAAGLTPTQGRLEVGPGQETTVPGLYLIGDAAGPPYWAHKAIAQGLAAVRHILGLTVDGRPVFIPACVYGHPEAAFVGLTEAEAKTSGRPFKLGEFHFIGNGRAGAMGDSVGLVRMISEIASGQVLGVHIIGPGATEMISLAALAMTNGLDVDGIKQTVFSHPTLAESFFEAALATNKQAIHLLPDGVPDQPE